MSIDGTEAEATYLPGSLSTIDTVPRPDLPVYSDGNFGEVAPDRLSPMSWSLVGTPMEAAARRLASRIAPGQDWFTGSRYAFVGSFALKPYHNLSAFCSLGSQMPGVEADDVTHGFFEGEPAPSQFEGARMTLPDRLRMVERFSRHWAAMLDLRMQLHDRIVELEYQASANDRRSTDVYRLLEEFRAVLWSSWEVHIAATSATVPLGTLINKFGRRVTQHWDDLESELIAPRDLVWHSLYGVHGVVEPYASGFLSAPFYEVADDVEPWTKYIKHREIVDVSDWTKRVDPAIDHLDGILGSSRSGAVRTAAGLLSRATEEREASKSLVMRTLHVGRSLLRSIAADRGIDDWSFLTHDELVGRSGHPPLGAAEAHEVIEARRIDVKAALSIDMPRRLDIGEPIQAAPQSMPEAQGELGEGRALTQGATPAVAGHVVRWPITDDFPFGEQVILVCESADADIQPYLPFVQGVVAERGSIMSHIAILCRAWSLPCIAHPRAGEIEAGSWLACDSTTGVLHVGD